MTKDDAQLFLQAFATWDVSGQIQQPSPVSFQTAFGRMYRDAEANAAALKALVAGAWRKQALALREAIDQGTPTWAVQRCACPGCTAGYVGVIARLKAAPDALDRQLTEARREAATLLAEVAQLRDRRPLMDVERAAARELAAKLRRQLDRLDEVVS